jgi:hypothetical protein
MANLMETCRCRSEAATLRHASLGDWIVWRHLVEKKGE